MKVLSDENGNWEKKVCLHTNNKQINELLCTYAEILPLLLIAMSQATIFEISVKYTFVFPGPGGVYPYGYGKYY